MKEKLQFTVIILFLFISSSKAQMDRSTLKVIDKTAVISFSEPVKTYPNIEEKKIPPTHFKSSKVGTNLDLRKSNSKVRLTEVIGANGVPAEKRVAPSGEITKVNQDRPSRNFKNKGIETASNRIKADVPIFPELNVTANREEPYVNSVVSKEVRPEELVRIKHATDEEQAPNKISASDPNPITLSPLKRKYLEGIVSQLEKEVFMNPNDVSVEMLAKKKELEDLKKLLAN